MSTTLIHVLVNNDFHDALGIFPLFEGLEVKDMAKEIHQADAGAEVNCHRRPEPQLSNGATDGAKDGAKDGATNGATDGWAVPIRN